MPEADFTEYLYSVAYFGLIGGFVPKHYPCSMCMSQLKFQMGNQVCMLDRVRRRSIRPHRVLLQIEKLQLAWLKCHCGWIPIMYGIGISIRDGVHATHSM